MKFTIRIKILLIVAMVAILASGVSSYVGYDISRRALEEESFKKLTAVREMKASQVEGYFRQIENQVITLSEGRMIIDAMKAFKAAFRVLDDELAFGEEQLEDVDLQLSLYYINDFLPRLNENTPDAGYFPDYWPDDTNTRILQYLYIATNQYDTGEKHLLDDAQDASTYSRVHRFYHPPLRHFLEKFGYYDIFLVDHETGHIVYTVFKEVDVGTSLLDGPYRATNFARAFRAARKAEHKDFVRLEDFEPYHPSFNAYASFIASPIFDGREQIGVLLFQMPVDRINAIMTNNQNWAAVGLGESGETYIVADDFTIRNQSRFLIEDKERYLQMIRDLGVDVTIVNRIDSLNNSIGLQEVRTKGTVAALKSETGSQIFEDYRGVRVLSAYKPLALRDVNWVIMSEIDEAEAFADTVELRNSILTSLMVVIGVSFVVAIAFSRTLTRPLTMLSQKAAELADGDLDAEIELSSKDELGELALSFNTMRVALKKTFAEVEQQKEELEDRVRDRTAELDTASEKLRVALSGMADGIYILDADLNFVTFNQRYVDLLDFPEGLVREGGPIADVAKFAAERGDYEGQFEGGIDDIVASRIAQIKSSTGSVTENITPTGRIVEYRGSPIKGGGYVTILNDITERNRVAEELTRAKVAADEANMAKSTFLLNMSHELRTPMNAIIGYAEMLAEDAEEDDDEDRLSDIKEIIDSAEHLLALVNDILDISKIESGKMELYLETFDLDKMVRDVASTTKALIEKNDNVLVMDIDDDIGEAHADLTKVRRILLNMVSNAAKFTSNGTITLFAKRYTEGEQDYLRLGVSDTGIGIPEDMLSEIFEEFAQVDDSTTRNIGGTGLGLALVKRFCQVMGGKVWAESVVGEGSSFIMDIPAIVTDQDAVAAVPESASATLLEGV